MAMRDILPWAAAAALVQKTKEDVPRLGIWYQDLTELSLPFKRSLHQGFYLSDAACSGQQRVRRVSNTRLQRTRSNLLVADTTWHAE